jgi:hypothetical protein
MTTLRALIDSSERPSIDPIDAVNYVLEQLRSDDSVDIADGVTWDANVTFEELIGALLIARDEIQRGRQQVLDDELDRDVPRERVSGIEDALVDLILHEHQHQKKV